MAVSENAGDLILTEAFESYHKYAGFTIRLRRGYDPESKGKTESVVKYVKGNFLSCRVYHGISSLNSECLSWLDRTANGKIHETTKMIPDIVFLEEARHLKPVPERSKPVKPQTPTVRKTNAIHYGQNRCQVPKGTYFPGRKARIALDEQGEHVSFYDAKTGKLLAEHTVDKGVGRLVRLKRNTGRGAGQMANLLKDKILAALDGFDDAKIYVDWLVARLKPRAARHASRLIEKYPRYVRDQLRIMYQCVYRIQP